MKKILLLLLSGNLILSAFAQPHDRPQPFFVKGSVVDADSQLPLVGAHVIIEDVLSGMQNATISDDKGNFSFVNIRAKKINLQLSFLGYQKYQKEMELIPGFNNAGKIALKPSTQNLDEVSVKKTVPLAVVREDTIEYKSDAYKTTPDANAEDLVAKMPGVEVSEGSVKAQGEAVKKFLVDGRPFFNSDPSLALRNLPAEIIEKVQIYEEQSEQSQFSGFDDGNTIRTMNVVTRRNMRNGQFGTFRSALGPEKKYALSANLNNFNSEQRISIIGQSNNINQQDFSMMDLLGGMNVRRGAGGPGGGGRAGLGGGGGAALKAPTDFLIGKKDGISSIHSFGTNYSDSWGEKVEVSFNYFYNYLDNLSDEQISRTYLSGLMENQVYDENDIVNTLNGNHRLFARIDYSPNSSNRIMFRPNIAIQNNTLESVLSGNLLKNSNILSTTYSNYESQAGGLNGSADLLFMHRFNKAGRTMSLNLGTRLSDRKAENNLEAVNQYFTNDVAELDSLNQFSDTKQPSKTISARIAYIEALSVNSTMQFSYSYSLNKNDSENLTWDKDRESDELLTLDSLLSGRIENLYHQQHAGLSYRFRKDRTMIMAGIDLEHTGLENDQEFPDPTQSAYSFNSLLPHIMLNRRGDDGKNLRIMFRTRSNIPSVSQLLEVVDNSNSLQLSTGNPNLRQELSHNLIMRYSSANIQKSSLFYAGFRLNADQNNISNVIYSAASDTILKGIQLNKGTRLIIPENLDILYNASLFVNYGVPVQLISCNLNVNSSVSLSRTPGKINNETGYSTDRIFSLGVSLVSNISEKIDFSLSTTGNYSIPVSSFNESLSDNYWYQLSRMKIRWILPLGLVFDSRLNYSFYKGLSEGFDEDFFLWNLSFGKKLFKNQRGEISLSVNDLFNANQAIGRTVSESYIEDSRKNVIERFYLINFRYDLRKMRF